MPLSATIRLAASSRQRIPYPDRYLTIWKFFSQPERYQNGLVAASTLARRQQRHCSHITHSHINARPFSSNALRRSQNNAEDWRRGKGHHLDQNATTNELADSKNAQTDTGQKASGSIPKSAEENQDEHSRTAEKQKQLQPYGLHIYPSFIRRLLPGLAHISRPSRDDLLNAATSFWQRIRIRFKWFTIKSFRKFNADDMSAFFSMFLVSQLAWILIGTTTFFSVVFWTINSLRLQEYVARLISDYLTSETGVTVIFESAIVPKWKDSRISFKNVYISRRNKDDNNAAPLQATRDVGHSAAVGYDVATHPAYHHRESWEDEHTEVRPSEVEMKYSTFDLNVDSIDVTLSLRRWFDGKGLIKDAEIKGIRGVLDRRQVTWDPNNPLNPADFRHIQKIGDFELDSLKLEDMLITVYQPGDFRPFTASIFRADIRTFRKQWMFYDFLSAENVVGQFDNCLFSLHKPQSIGRTTEQDLKDKDWGSVSRIRIDGVNVDHIQGYTTHGGPISWIKSGKVDAVLDIKFPREAEDEVDFKEILGGIAEAITAAASASQLNDFIPGQRELAKPPLTAPPLETSEELVLTPDHNSPRVIVDIDLRFRDLKAAVPIFTESLSYTNSALIRPIVAFMNANRTLVPIRCRVIKDLSDFDGSWTIWETALMDDVATQTYEALAYHVTRANMNNRVKVVGVWSLQMTASGVLSAMRKLMDPMRAHMQTLYSDGLPVTHVLS